MRKFGVFSGVVLCLAMCFVFVACGSSSSNEDKKNSSTPVKTAKTLPPLETSTTSNVPATSVLSEGPFLLPQEIEVKWPQTEICALVSSSQAQRILSMKTSPTGIHTFSADSGSRCTYRSSSGDELFIEISIFSFAKARIVDSALNSTISIIKVKGIGGVSKTSSASGTTYELNINGENSNQWIVNSPNPNVTKKLAETLIESLR